MEDDHEELLARFLAGDNAEAMEWLRGGSDGAFRTLSEMTPAESVEFVRRLYELGADQVLAVEIDVYAEEANTGHLLVKLPADGGARDRLFAFERLQSASQGFDAEADRGQDYLYLKLD